MVLVSSQLTSYQSSLHAFIHSVLFFEHLLGSKLILGTGDSERTGQAGSLQFLRWRP